MKKVLFTMLALVLMVGLALPMALPAAATEEATKDYGDVTLSDWGQGNFPEIWDLTKCDLTLSYTLDMSGIATAGWVLTEVGLREVGGTNIDPNYQGGWLESIYKSADSDDDKANINDYHVLMIHGWLDEYYDREGAFPGSTISPAIPYVWTYHNHAFSFDRDGVDQWQADYWNYKDGITYNTGGVYDVEIQYHADSATEGVMYVTINGEAQGFYTQGYESGFPPEMMPVGRTFSGDMTRMQVFYGRGSGGGTVDINDIEVDGCLAIVLCAGQNTPVGTVRVWNDEDTLYVKYETDGDWMLAETHLAVAETLEGIPQTKKGNPIPGHFEYSMDHNPLVQEYTYEIPFGTPEACDIQELVIAAHAEVLKLMGEGCGEPQWATDNIADSQGPGWLSDGTPTSVIAGRSDPTDALGEPDAAGPPWQGFFSLGLNGDITVGFGYPIYNGGGEYDISVHEVSGNRGNPTENASVYVMVDGVAYFAGEVSSSDQGNGIGTVSIPDQFAFVDAVKVVDTTDKALHVGLGYAGDGYDVDAVDACYLIEQEETAWGDGCEGEPFPGKNWATYIDYQVQCHPCAEPSGSLSVTGTGWISDSAWCPCNYKYDLTDTGEPVALQGFVDTSETAVVNTDDWSKYYAKFIIIDSNGYNVAVVFNSDWLGDWYEMPAQPWDRIRMENNMGLAQPLRYYATEGGVLGYDMSGTWVGPGNGATVYPSDGNYFFQLIADPAENTFTLQVYGKGSGAPDNPPADWPKQNMFDEGKWLDIGTIDVGEAFDFEEVSLCAELWASTQAGAEETSTIYWDGMEFDTPLTFEDVP